LDFSTSLKFSNVTRLISHATNLQRFSCCISIISEQMII